MEFFHFWKKLDPEENAACFTVIRGCSFREHFVWFLEGFYPPQNPIFCLFLRVPKSPQKILVIKAKNLGAFCMCGGQIFIFFFLFLLIFPPNFPFFRVCGGFNFSYFFSQIFPFFRGVGVQFFLFFFHFFLFFANFFPFFVSCNFFSVAWQFFFD